MVVMHGVHDLLCYITSSSPEALEVAMKMHVICLGVTAMLLVGCTSEKETAKDRNGTRLPSRPQTSTNPPETAQTHEKSRGTSTGPAQEEAPSPEKIDKLKAMLGKYGDLRKLDAGGWRV